MGGSTSYVNNSLVYGSASLQFASEIESNNLIHLNCNADKCEYEEVKVWNRATDAEQIKYVCKYHGYFDSDGSPHTCKIPDVISTEGDYTINGLTKHYSKGEYISVNLYGYEEDSEEITTDATGNKVCPCYGKVDRDAIDAYVKKHPNLEAHMDHDSSGNLIYPTVNVFLTTCDESADIRFSVDSSGNYLGQNGLFGWIYAPYMTYLAEGNNSGGGFIRICGGLVVSDYVIADSYSNVYCRPEIDYADLMSSTCLENLLKPNGDRSWRVYGH
jgi:putative lipoic acid-binding regulatory protein